ncbi:hypothetical protein [Arthrobacter sp. MMS18-M83]|uniref:hypothetical protein n=1 Tax=Arthrobacter sp. MMS18-M83 TaxID=2996261 RepID=UPI00227C62BC|nr:hypothetical protein [Arthrobacter sp. MMS18-M83]WAH95813.1 hypothetical protein OW521_15375 [Arthrobacter sp. MMS18-M83]
MSTPPYPPSTPGENPTPEQPQYGQQTPQPGQQPQYGQQTPQTGQQPQYGQPPAPQYGQQAPQYGQQAPQYGQQAPQPGQQPQYGQPSAPQYGQQAPQYGQFSVPQYGQSGPVTWPSQQPAGTSGVPELVNTAFLMIVSAGVLSFVSAMVLAFTGGDTFTAIMQQSAAQQGQRLPAGALQSMQGAIIIGAIIGGLISLGLYALVAFPVRKGKNWARILGTVFAAISLFSLLGGSFTFGLLYGLIQTVTILLGIAAMVLLYLPGSAPYFRKAQPFPNPYNQAPYGR